MGFYGQVVYEFTKMFSKFMVIKNQNSEIPIIPSDNPVDKFFEATTMWEQFNVEPTNRWIQLDGEGGNSDIKTIKIGHSSPGSKDDAKTAVSFSQISENELPELSEPPIELKNGDFLKIVTTTHDAAGHMIDLADTNYSYYKLPTAQLIVVPPDNEKDEPENTIKPNDNDILQAKGDGQWITLVNNNNALKISHTIPTIETAVVEPVNISSLSCLSPTTSITPDAYLGAMSAEGKDEEEIAEMTTLLKTPDLSSINIIPLEGGDLIQTYTTALDANGHVLQTSPIYYKLPTNPAEVSFDIHEARLSELEERLDNGTLNNGTTYGTYEDIVEKVYEAGVLDNMYSDFEHQNITITETIGPVDGVTNSITAAINSLTGDDKDVYTISQAIQEIAKEVKYQGSILSLITDKLKDVGIIT